jgi:hypothetical protein
VGIVVPQFLNVGSLTLTHALAKTMNQPPLTAKAIMMTTQIAILATMKKRVKIISICYTGITNRDDESV